MAAVELTLYSVPESLYSAKLRMVLRLKGIGFEEVPPPGGYGTPAYRRIVPAGTVPAIVHGDLVLGDSEAIAEYLNDAWPAPPLWPDGAAARARARERSRFHDTRLEPEVRALFGSVAPGGRDAGFVAAQAVRINDRLAQFAGLLTAAPAGPDLTLGDCGFPASFLWLDLFFPTLGPTLQWPDAVVAYRAAVERHDEVARELRAYRVPAEAWMAAKLAA